MGSQERLFMMKVLSLILLLMFNFINGCKRRSSDTSNNLNTRKGVSVSVVSVVSYLENSQDRDQALFKDDTSPRITDATSVIIPRSSINGVLPSAEFKFF